MHYAWDSGNLIQGYRLYFYGSSYGSAPLFLYSGLGSIVFSYLFNGIGETKVVFKCSLINLLVFLPLAPALTIAYHVPGLIVASLKYT
jgi:O-antigen/teichoic acid export membrane protein